MTQDNGHSFADSLFGRIMRARTPRVVSAITAMLTDLRDLHGELEAGMTTSSGDYAYPFDKIINPFRATGRQWSDDPAVRAEQLAYFLRFMHQWHLDHPDEADKFLLTIPQLPAFMHAQVGTAAERMGRIHRDLWADYTLRDAVLKEMGGAAMSISSPQLEASMDRLIARLGTGAGNEGTVSDDLQPVAYVARAGEVIVPPSLPAELVQVHSLTLQLGRIKELMAQYIADPDAAILQSRDGGDSLAAQLFGGVGG